MRNQRITLTCVFCQRSFSVSPSRVKYGRRFCGVACGARGMANERHVDPAIRFWAKVDKNAPVPDYRPDLGPCWIWTACITADGYGSFAPNRIARLAHRVAYELIVGAIPDGLTIDHLCRVRSCVNPGHLDVVTPGENYRRGLEARGLAQFALDAEEAV